jgi:hypothetical protein
MSNEGLALISRAALVVFLVVAASFFRTLVGPGRKRGRFLLAGTIGGMSLGVAVAYFISDWIKIDVSVIAACLGMSVGWGIAWLFARSVPREAH